MRQSGTAVCIMNLIVRWMLFNVFLELVISTSVLLCKYLVPAAQNAPVGNWQ
jgi:hypothetical protein